MTSIKSLRTFRSQHPLVKARILTDLRSKGRDWLQCYASRLKICDKKRSHSFEMGVLNGGYLESALSKMIHGGTFTVLVPNEYFAI